MAVINLKLCRRRNVVAIVVNLERLEIYLTNHTFMFRHKDIGAGITARLILRRILARRICLESQRAIDSLGYCTLINMVKHDILYRALYSGRRSKRLCLLSIIHQSSYAVE